MFAPRYFPHRYFAPRYFPDNGAKLAGPITSRSYIVDNVVLQPSIDENVVLHDSIEQDIVVQSFIK
jgi:hypothetical protein